VRKATVAEELLSHFRDGLNQGGSPGELVRDFRDSVQAARLIGRAKRRNRPLAYRASVRSMQAACGLMGLILLLYGIAAIRFFAGRPNPAVDFFQWLNAATLAARPADRAWPEYRAAILSLPPTTRGYVATGRGLRELPAIDLAFREGGLRWTQVRELVRVATPET